MLKLKQTNKKKALTIMGLIISISLFWVMGRTEFLGNLFGIIAGRGYIIPSESSIFYFKVTKMNNGSGEWWLYAEDENYYYSMMETSNKKPYILIPKKLINDCKGFDKINYETWCLKSD